LARRAVGPGQRDAEVTLDIDRDRRRRRSHRPPVMRLATEFDATHARVVEHDLTVQAVGQLTAVVSGLSLEALAPVKHLLKPEATRTHRRVMVARRRNRGG
jgi:uncharacterized membrane protein YozB (DUF420 family)